MSVPAETRTQPAGFQAARRAAALAVALKDGLATTAPIRVLVPLVVVQWLAVAALALSVGHNGWIFYQGGDQLWLYTTGWLLAHGHLAQPLVGYGLPTFLAPLAAIFGPNFAQALPAIVILQFLFLLPIALVTAYGIGARLGGRIFGYWTAAAWIAAPFIGIEYTNVGYHQRYTELTLPQAFGLTGMADFPSMVALMVSAYLLLRVIDGGDWTDAALAGLVGGFAIGIKPSSALYLGGVGLAFLWSRRWRGAALFAAGLAPTVVVLTVWKWRGYGYLPLMHQSLGPTERLAAGASSLPMAFIGHHYVQLDWHHLHMQILSLQEHFFSSRLVEWFSFAGVVALLRVSRPAALLFGGWWFAYVIGKGTFPDASIDDSSLLRLMITAGPAFLMLLAALPLLLPRMPQRLRRSAPTPWAPPRVRIGAIAASVALFALVPLGFATVATPLRASDGLAYVVANNVPVPVDDGIHLTATASGGSVALSWPAAHPSGGRVFYRVFRGQAGAAPDCSTFPGRAVNCVLPMTIVGTTRDGSFVDKPGAGKWAYRIGVAANWLNDTSYGDVYVLSPEADAATTG